MLNLINVSSLFSITNTAIMLGVSCLFYFVLLIKRSIEYKFAEIPYAIVAVLMAFSLVRLQHMIRYTWTDENLWLNSLLFTISITSVFLILKYGKEQSYNPLIKKNFRWILVSLVVILYSFFLLFDSSNQQANKDLNNLLIWSYICLAFSANTIFLFLNKNKEIPFSRPMGFVRLFISVALLIFITKRYPDNLLIRFVVCTNIALDVIYNIILHRYKIYKSVNITKVKFINNPLFESVWAKKKEQISFSHGYQLRIISKDHWTYKSEQNDYVSEIKLIEGNILFEIAKGHTTTIDTKLSLERIKAIIVEMKLDQYGFYYVSDSRKIKGSSVGARQYVIDFNTNQKGLNRVYLITTGITRSLFKLILPLSPAVFRRWKVFSDSEECMNELMLEMSGTNDANDKILGVFRNRRKNITEQRIDQLYDILSKISFNSFDKLPQLNIEEDDPFYDVFQSLEVITTDKKEMIKSLNEIISNTQGALNERNAQFKALFENSTFQSGVFDENSILIDCNDLFVQHYLRLGLNVKKGHNINDFLREDEAIAVSQHKEIAKSKGHVDYEHSVEFLDGKIEWFRTKVFTVHNQESKIRYYGFLKENITEKVGLQKQQKRLLSTLSTQNDKMKDFNHMIAHELNHHTASLTQLINSVSDEDFFETNKELITKSLHDVNLKLNNCVQKMNEAAYENSNTKTLTDLADNAINTPKLILLIDDDSVTNTLNQMIVKRAFPSTQIQVCVNGVDALKFLSESEVTPDIVLLDINMPIMNGWEFLEECITRKLKFDIHMLSSSKDPSEKEMALVYPIVKSFVHKPLDSEKFNLVIEQSNLSVA